VTTRPLVGSTGVLPRIAASVPIVFTGQVVELAPGGQTGKQRTLVPSYVYVLEGVLTIDTEGGPTGVSGVQYHGTGHSYAPPPGLWFNAMNNGTTPARYLFLLVGTPGGPTRDGVRGRFARVQPPGLSGERVRRVAASLVEERDNWRRRSPPVRGGFAPGSPLRQGV